jgi:cysteine sulfinate desulfinase/cysteine desulfurase-like protein
VIFTSCATESNNTAIAAALRATGVPPMQVQNQTRAGRPWHGKQHIVTSQVEHSSVLNYCVALCSGGFIPPFGGGEITSPHGLRNGGFTPPFSVAPMAEGGGVKPPLQEFGYRVTYLPVDREGLAFPV